MMVRFALLSLAFAALPALGAEPAELQDKMKKLIDAAGPSVVSLVVSHNPKHAIPRANRPWELGDYRSPAVASFRGRQPDRDKLDLADVRNAADYTLGSAVVLDATDGLLLTCYHLIDGARKIHVRLPGSSGSYADLVAGDARSDLAVLRLRSPSRGLKAVKFADVRTHDTPRAKATVSRGQWVIAIAHPFAAGNADGQATASWGIVGNVGRRSPLPPGADDIRPGYLHQYGSLIQTDARANLGSSGGGLFNLDGDLIGLASAAAGVAGSEAAGGYALPMDDIYRGIVDVLRRGHEVEYGFLGVAPDRLSADPRRPGLYVSTVTPGSPAALAGIEANDLIQSVNGRPIQDDGDLFLLIGGALAGKEIKLAINSQNQTRDVRATLAKFQHPYPSIASTPPPSYSGLRIDYSSLMVQQLIGPGARMGLNLNGVIVRDFEPNSRAEAAFRQLAIGQGRWLITKVNGTPVANPPAFHAAAAKSQSLRLTVVNAMDYTGTERTVTLP
jgi:serine protease Do